MWLFSFMFNTHRVCRFGDKHIKINKFISAFLSNYIQECMYVNQPPKDENQHYPTHINIILMLQLSSFLIINVYLLDMVHKSLCQWTNFIGWTKNIPQYDEQWLCMPTMSCYPCLLDHSACGTSSLIAFDSDRSIK